MDLKEFYFYNKVEHSCQEEKTQILTDKLNQVIKEFEHEKELLVMKSKEDVIVDVSNYKRGEVDYVINCKLNVINNSLCYINAITISIKKHSGNVVVGNEYIHERLELNPGEKFKTNVAIYDDNFAGRCEMEYCDIEFEE